jgi:fatty acid-binding protein DegV
VANLLSVKPILTLRDGTLDLLERVRTRANAWRRVIELVVQAAGQKPVEQMAILHVNALAEARQFEEQLRASESCPDSIMLAGLSPGLP